MKKLLSLLCLLLAGAAYLSAQNVVSGTVTDRDGNPIPGAKVNIVGGTESVITELDGTFRLETQTPAKKVQVVYAGMQPKTQRVKPDMVVKLSNTGWWNGKPENYDWIISAQGMFIEKGAKNPSFGLMIGRVKKLGWYVKGVYNVPNETTGQYYDINSVLHSAWTTGKEKRTFIAVTAGMLIRLGCPIHLYVGGGAFERVIGWQVSNGEYWRHKYLSYSGYAAEAGLMIRINKLAINGGVMYATEHIIANIGLGLTF
jgi:hypothetical protein